MMKIKRQEVKTLKLPTRTYESNWINSRDTVSLPLDSFAGSTQTGIIPSPHHQTYFKQNKWLEKKVVYFDKFNNEQESWHYMYFPSANSQNVR